MQVSPRRKRAVAREIGLLLLVGLPFAALQPAIAAPAAPVPHAAAKMQPARQRDFQNAMRKLWEDHVAWTRLFLISAIADLPDKGPTTERLLKNQVDIGNALKPYYGDAAGEKLTALLNTHITTAAEVVTAAKGDAARLDDAKKRWFANADDIATFLSDANPKRWPLVEMKQMMRDHLILTTTEVEARLKGDWTADIAAYDKVNTQILQMADMLSIGILSQFPGKFA
jgi:hypothetical protein